MKSLFISKRCKAILGIGVLPICIGAISKKFISYPSGGCTKRDLKTNFIGTNPTLIILGKP